MVLGIILFHSVSAPIVKLANDIDSISRGHFGQTVKTNSRDEIGALAGAFNKMSVTIKNYTDDLIKGKRQMETIFNSITGILFIRDGSYNIKIVNREGVEYIRRYDKDHLNGKCYEVFADRTEPCENCPADSTISTSEEASSDIVLNNRVYRVSSYPVFDYGNRITEIVVFRKDITDELMIKKKLAQSEKLAEIGQITAGVTHELKNPITVIKGAHYLLTTMVSETDLEHGVKDEITELLDRIGDSIRHSEKTISNLLDFSRQSVKTVEKVNIVRIIEQILILEKNNFIHNNVEVETEFENDNICIYSNLDSLKHIFLNLVANAVQAMPHGGRLSIRAKRCPDAVKEKVMVQIEDTGCGIPEDLQTRIFDPFITTKDSGKGSGLGLWIVKNEINRHNGEIMLDSMPGKGSCFTIIFPVR